MACEIKIKKIGQDEKVYVGQDPVQVWTWQPQHNSYIGASACTPMHILIRMQLHASVHWQVLACPIYSYEETSSDKLLGRILSYAAN